MDDVLTIGEKTVADEMQLEKLKSDLEKAREKYNTANNEKAHAEKYINNKYREISESVVGAVGGAGGRWRSNSDFNAGVVRRAFDGLKDFWTKLDVHELRKCISLADRESPTTDSMVNPDEVCSAVTAVFEFIDALDPDHLDGHCAVLEVDKNALLSV